MGDVDFDNIKVQKIDTEAIQQKQEAENAEQLQEIQDDTLSLIEKYEMKDSNDPFNQPFLPLNGFKGAKVERKMTDVWCIPIFVILNAAFVAGSIILYINGAPQRLSNGQDYRAQVCGHGTYIKEQPFLYFANPIVDVNVAFCVEKCPTTTGQTICVYDQKGVNYKTNNTNLCYTQIASTYFGKYCLPKEPRNREKVDVYLGSLRNTVNKAASDLSLSADLIVIGTGLSILLASIFRKFLKIPEQTKFFVWGCIWGSTASFGMLAILFQNEYARTIQYRCLFNQDKHDCGGSRAYYFTLLMYLSIIVGILYMVVVMKLFNQINLATGFIKSSSQIAKVLVQLNNLPFVMTGIGIVFGTIVVISIIYGLSVGVITEIKAQTETVIDGSQMKIIEYPEYMTYAVIACFYMFFVWMLFVLEFNNLFTSYALSIWFFAKKKSTVEIPLGYTLQRMIQFHVGTVIYYTLLSSLCKLPAFFLGLIVSSFQRLPQTSYIVRFMEACCLPCIFIYQAYLRYMNQHSFVQVSLWCDGFSQAGKKAYFLLNRHKEHFQDLDFLQAFIVLQVQLCCSLGSAIFVYIYISFVPVSPILLQQMSLILQPIIPTVVVFFIAFFISEIFLGSFDMMSKTVIQLYYLDQEMFYGEQRFVQKFIKEFMDFYGEQAVKKVFKSTQKEKVKIQKMRLNDVHDIYSKQQAQINAKEAQKEDNESVNSANDYQDDEEEQAQQKNDDDEDEENDGDEEDDDDGQPEQEEFEGAAQSNLPLSRQTNSFDPIKPASRGFTPNKSNFFLNNNPQPGTSSKPDDIKPLQQVEEHSSGVFNNNNRNPTASQDPFAYQYDQNNNISLNSSNLHTQGNSSRPLVKSSGGRPDPVHTQTKGFDGLHFDADRPINYE